MVAMRDLVCGVTLASRKLQLPLYLLRLAWSLLQLNVVICTLIRLIAASDVSIIHNCVEFHPNYNYAVSRSLIRPLTTINNLASPPGIEPGSNS